MCYSSLLLFTLSLLSYFCLDNFFILLRDLLWTGKDMSVTHSLIIHCHSLPALPIATTLTHLQADSWRRKELLPFFKWECRLCSVWNFALDLFISERRKSGYNLVVLLSAFWHINVINFFQWTTRTAQIILSCKGILHVLEGSKKVSSLNTIKSYP